MGDLVSLDYVEVTLNGDARPRKLSFGIAEIRDLQKRVGQPLAVIVAQLGMLNIETSAHCLYMGLRRDDAKLKPEAVDKLIEAHGKGGGDLDELDDFVIAALKAGGWLKRDRRSAPQIREQIARLEAELALVEAEEEPSSEDPPPSPQTTS